MNETKLNYCVEKSFVRVVFLLGILLVPLSGFAQGFSETVIGPRGTKIIDHRPMPDPGEQALRSKATKSASDPPPAPLEDTFFLHSRPGATKVIYLDFDGHTYSGGSYPAWNFEGSDSTFSDTELTVIQLSWRSISEEFRPFDVDVTTEFPGIEALKNTGGGDTEWGVRAVINHSSYDYSWAYSGSFSDSTDTELYAWSGDDPSEYETWVWIAGSVSHESGHALGLSHDGGPGEEYYQCHGADETEWCPLMGWGGYGVNQWDKGEYTDANNQQDDLDIITTQNGFGYRPDDHGSTIGTATVVDINLSSVANGIIERTNDIDYFEFTMASGGNVSLDINGDYLDSNLDILAKIHDPGGTVLFTSNPPTGLDAAFDVFLDAGDYYLSIDGTGYDDPTSDGYSDYGSLGYYSIEGIGGVGVPALTHLATALLSGVLGLLGLLGLRRLSKSSG